MKRVFGCGAAALMGTFGALAVSAGSASAADAATTPYTLTFSYEGHSENYTVPDGVGHLQIVGEGGRGGDDLQSDFDQGAVVGGTIAVVPGEQFLISVGGTGSTPESSTHDVPGGWGGMGANGGNGNGASDRLRSSGGGGGATTVEEMVGSQWQPVFIAGGGGGQGGPSGDQMTPNYGGGAGWASPSSCKVSNESWNGADGDNGSSILGGSGGRSASEAGMSGGRGQGGHGLGGNGGGGGGGVVGGAGGGGAKGTSSGGGGGAGGSANYLLDNVSVGNAYCNSIDPGGRVTITPSA